MPTPRRLLPLLIAAFAAAICSTPASALAADTELPGFGKYQQGDFQGAAKDLSDALPNLPLERRSRARMFLSASWFALGDEQATRAALQALFLEAPQARMDPLVFDPDLVAVAERIRVEEAAKIVRPSSASDAPKGELKVSRTRGPLPYVFGGGALATLGAGVLLANSSAGQRAELDRSFDPSGNSSLTFAQAQSLQQGADRDMTLAVTAAVASAALTGVAIWLWTRVDP